MERWPHQTQAVSGVQAAIGRGERCIVLVSPTGGGKSLIACDLIDAWTAEGHKTVVYTNRRMLVDQLSRVLETAGIDHGIRAAGHQDERELDVQIASVPTERSRTFRTSRWALHDAQRVVIDEAHLQTSKIPQAICRLHLEAGAVVLGLTATPLDLAGMYDCLIQAGTNSELRACGALVWCHHYACDGPDLVAWRQAQKEAARIRAKMAQGVDLSEAEQRQLIMTPGVMGRVLDHYRRLNPEGKPSILFAPGVGESRWFAEQFHKAGISAAHIDGQEVWINGHVYRTDAAARKAALDGSRDGSIRVLCNRFVLREGIDAPWLRHGMLATVFGSLQSYLQSGGRLLRAHPSLDCVTLQDHGDNWLWHGSLNADRLWAVGDTAARCTARRDHRLRSKGDVEPIRCPRCGLVCGGWKCGACGYEMQPSKRSRPVVQSDGTLREMEGDAFTPRRISKKPNGAKLWERMFWRSRTEKGSRTFRAAIALFAQENNWGFPDPAWPYMPKEEDDFFRLVKDVPVERLIQKGQS